MRNFNVEGLLVAEIPVGVKDPKESNYCNIMVNPDYIELMIKHEEGVKVLLTSGCWVYLHCDYYKLLAQLTR